MRIVFMICLLPFLSACESSSRKDPNKAIQDSSHRENPAVRPGKPDTIRAVKIDNTQIPADIKISGSLKEAWKWSDKMGDNILVLSQVAPHDDKEKNEYGEEGQSAALHAVLYKKTGDRYLYQWGLKDEVKSCPFDITCSFITGSATITDLNNNGFAEIKLQYRTACRSDVSPSAMKLTMWENGTEYGLTGDSWIADSPDLKFDVNENNVNLELTPPLKDEFQEMRRRMGRYESERQFKNAPPEFLPYARQQWIRFVKESFE